MFIGNQSCWSTDLKHLNQALVLLQHYKNSPPISKSWIRAWQWISSEKNLTWIKRDLFMIFWKPENPITRSTCSKLWRRFRNVWLQTWLIFCPYKMLLAGLCIDCKWFESRSISSSYCVIVWVRVVLKRTVVGDWRFDNLSGSHLQSQVNSSCQSMIIILTDVNNYRRLTNCLSMTETKPTNGLLTDRLNSKDQKTDNFTNNRRIETHQWLVTNFTRVFQPIPSWLNWPITFNWPTS